MRHESSRLFSIKHLNRLTFCLSVRLSTDSLIAIGSNLGEFASCGLVQIMQEVLVCLRNNNNLLMQWRGLDW